MTGQMIVLPIPQQFEHADWHVLCRQMDVDLDELMHACFSYVLTDEYHYLEEIKAKIDHVVHLTEYLDGMVEEMAEEYYPVSRRIALYTARHHLAEVSTLPHRGVMLLKFCTLH